MNAFDMLFRLQELELTKSMLSSAKPMSERDKVQLMEELADQLKKEDDSLTTREAMRIAKEALA